MNNAPRQELADLFANCFPNTLDTTVHFEVRVMAD